MLGYGDESDHFVLELTYNYGVNVYERGNDLAGIFIQNPDAFGRVEKRGIDREQITVDGYVALKDPDGHSIFLSADTSPTEDPLVKVAISVEDMTRSIRFWRDLARMSVFSENDKNTVMGYAETQVCY